MYGIQFVPLHLFRNITLYESNYNYVFYNALLFFVVNK